MLFKHQTDKSLVFLSTDGIVDADVPEKHLCFLKTVIFQQTRCKPAKLNSVVCLEISSEIITGRIIVYLYSAGRFLVFSRRVLGGTSNVVHGGVRFFYAFLRSLSAESAPEASSHQKNNQQGGRQNESKYLNPPRHI